MATSKRSKKRSKRSTRFSKRPREKTTGRGRTERRADQRLVERTIALLHRHDHLVGGSMVEVGEHLLDSFFGGDADLARSREPVKARSYRLLAERAAKETEWDEDDFRRAVSAAIVARSLPSGLVGKFPATTLVRLLAIDDPARRVEIAKRIVDEHLAGVAGRELITRASGDERHGGRERLAGPVRVVAGAERLVELAEELDAFDRSEVRRVPETARGSLRRRLRQAIDRLEELDRALAGQ